MEKIIYFNKNKKMKKLIFLIITICIILFTNSNANADYKAYVNISWKLYGPYNYSVDILKYQSSDNIIYFFDLNNIFINWKEYWPYFYLSKSCWDICNYYWTFFEYQESKSSNFKIHLYNDIIVDESNNIVYNWNKKIWIVGKDMSYYTTNGYLIYKKFSDNKNYIITSSWKEYWPIDNYYYTKYSLVYSQNNKLYIIYGWVNYWEFKWKLIPDKNNKWFYIIDSSKLPEPKFPEVDLKTDWLYYLKVDNIEYWPYKESPEIISSNYAYIIDENKEKKIYTYKVFNFKKQKQTKLIPKEKIDKILNKYFERIDKKSKNEYTFIYKILSSRINTLIKKTKNEKKKELLQYIKEKIDEHLIFLWLYDMLGKEFNELK